MKKRKIKHKKIVVFIPEFPNVTETFIQRDILSLVKMGELDISVVTLAKGSGKLFAELEDYVHVRRLTLSTVFKALSSILKNTGTFKEFYNLLNQEEGSSHLKNFYLVFKSFGYAQILQKFNPDEIHAHFYSDISTLAMLSAKLLDIPFSVSAHARDVLEYPHLPKIKAQLCKFIVVCNKNAYDKLVEFAGAHAAKVHLIHHGVDPTTLFSSVDTKSLVRTNVPTIFMGGTRLTQKKGIEYMVRASKILKDEGFKHRVLLIGPTGPLYFYLTTLIEKLDVADTFVMKTKGVPFEELAPHYFTSDICVLPNIEVSSGDVDGIPNILVEASLAELPIITTDAGSNLELVENGVTGVVVTQRDPQGLVDAIKRLWSISESERELLGKNAHEKALKMFGAESTVVKFQQLLQLKS